MLQKPHFGEYLHVAHASCKFSTEILDIIRELGGNTYLLIESCANLPGSLKNWRKTVLYFDIAADSHVPSQQVRMLKRRDIDHGRVQLPTWIDHKNPPFGRLIGVTTRNTKERDYRARRTEGLINLHERDLGRPGDPSKISRIHVSRTDWRKQPHETVEWAGRWP